VAGPARAIVAPVEKAASEEDGQPGGAMERDQGGRPCSGTVEMLAIEPPTTVENAEAVWRSASARATMIFSRAKTIGYG
jgi:hypothetical protein